MESVRAKHAAELEAKRKKLEEIRKRKAAVRGNEEGQSGPAVGTPNMVDLTEHKMDDFIQNILKTSTPSTTDQTNDASLTSDARLQATMSLAEKLSQLSTSSNVAELHIQPTLVETYTKHTETDITLEHEITVRKVDGDDIDSLPRKFSRSMSAISVSMESASGGIDSAPPSMDQKILSTGNSTKMVLTDEERKTIMQSESMEKFLTRASSVIERALTSSSKFDVMIDYASTLEEDEHTDETNELTLKELIAFRDEKLTKHRSVTAIDISPFYSELFLVAYTSRNFLEDDDTIMDNTLKSTEDSTAEHHRLLPNEKWDTIGDSTQQSDDSLALTTDGVLLIWSTQLQSRPEYIFACHSQVTSACFNPFDRHLIIGGTYSGQIVVWDIRAKFTPVQKSPLSNKSHTHPIYAIAVIGSKSSYSIVSASTDGRVCIWDNDQLQMPSDTMDLRSSISISTATPSATRSDNKMEVAITAFAPQADSLELFVGTEAGKIYATKLHQHKSQKPAEATLSVSATEGSNQQAIDHSALTGADSLHTSDGSASDNLRVVLVSAICRDNLHFGPISSMHFNPIFPSHQQALLLTGSLDSTIKLWSTENPQSPIFSFESSNEYICDVRWSPINVSLFAVADGSGLLSLWNIVKDIEAAQLEAQVSTQGLSKIQWSADGKSIAVGDVAGNTCVYEVPAEVAVPQGDEMSLLVEAVGLNSNSALSSTKQL